MQRLSRTLKEVAACSGGSFAVEFAIALPILLLLSAGLYDLGIYAFQKSALSQAAREGAQYGMLNSNDLSAVNTTAQNYTGLTGVTATSSLFWECTTGTSVTTQPTCSGGVTPKKFIIVTTTRSFSSVIGSMNFGAFGRWAPPTTVTASVTMQVTGN